MDAHVAGVYSQMLPVIKWYYFCSDELEKKAKDCDEPSHDAFSVESLKLQRFLRCSLI